MDVQVKKKEIEAGVAEFILRLGSIVSFARTFRGPFIMNPSQSTGFHRYLDIRASSLPPDLLQAAVDEIRQMTRVLKGEQTKVPSVL